MLRRRGFLATIPVLCSALLLTGCGAGTSGNVDVVLVDRSTSFCQLLPDCSNKISPVLGDKLTVLSKGGGSLRVLLIGNDSVATLEASSNDRCTDILRGAAACFSKPTLWNSIFGTPGVQKKAALAKIKVDVTAGIASGPTRVGTSIFDAIVTAQHYLDDRRLPSGQGTLVILSDMIEESKTKVPPLTCANVGTPAQNERVLDLLRRQGRLPDLHYIIVEALGVSAINQLNAPCRESFWRAYFVRTGAELSAYQPL